MQRSTGFTLIELVIVLVILGVLAAVAVPQLGGTADTADRTALRAQANAISSANSANVANCRLSENPDDCINFAFGGACVNAADEDNAIDSLFEGNFDTDTYSSNGDINNGECENDGEFRFEITSTDGNTVGESHTCCLAN